MAKLHRSPTRKRSWLTTLALTVSGLLVLCLAGIFAVLLWFYLFRSPSTAQWTRPEVVQQTAAWQTAIPLPTQVLVAQVQGASAVQPALTLTPYQPVRNTPVPTHTPTPTATATSTATTTPTATATLTVTATEAPTLTAVAVLPPDGLPERASVTGITGYAQTLPLSCEARSAVDWASYFGVAIGEMDFQYQLPSTGNPNTGFVGDPHDERGGTPPNAYGVHAPPVAALLRNYGLKAQAASGWDWDSVRREIASGQPVIAWVIGNAWPGYHGRRYTAPDGETLTVAAFEHTVILSAYTPNSVTVVDNNLVYIISLDQFLDSWAVLENMVVYLND